MPESSDSYPIRLCLGTRDGLGRIHVETESFFEFSFWLAEELEDLVASQQIQKTQPASTSRRSFGSHRAGLS